jgi:cell division protein FtsL
VTSPARPLPLPGTPGLRVLPGVAARPAPRLGPWLLLTVVVLAAFFLLIYSRIALDRSAFVLEEIGRQTAVEEARYWELRLESSRLQAPERIVARAQELGMVYPDRVGTLEVAGMGASATGAEEHWVDLKALLGAQP